MHQDATNRPLKKGSYIAYAAGGSGSRSHIKFGCVVALKEKVVEKNHYDANSQTWEPGVETEYKVQIISVEKPTWGTDRGKWIVQGKTEGKLARVQTIDRLERLVMLEPHQVHPEAKEVLDKELHERGQL